MELICINVSLSLESQKFLSPITNKLEVTAAKREAFLHTTIFQGVVGSFNKLAQWLASGSSCLNDKRLIESLKTWDRNEKSIRETEVLKYNDDLASMVLNYSGSNTISELSTKLARELRDLGLILDKTVTEELEVKEKENDFSFNYALNYQYKTKSICPHTTLGLDPKVCKVKNEIDLLLTSPIQQKNILHDKLNLSLIDKFCMTKIKGNIVLKNLNS